MLLEIKDANGVPRQTGGALLFNGNFGLLHWVMLQVMDYLAINLKTFPNLQLWASDHWNWRFLQSLVLITLTGMLLSFAGCTSEKHPTVSGDLVDADGLRLITRPDAMYTIDDLVAVGFKKNKQFEVDEVPGATDIWYGFFQQKDIEVRFYESHASALKLGVELAEVVIAKKAGQRDFLIPVVNLYPAYAVVGNTVMLCERQLSTCEALIEILN